MLTSNKIFFLFFLFLGTQLVTKDLLSSLIQELKDNTASNDKKYKCRKCR